ncbi:MAG: M24 family metallopeptidase [Chloroflexi bacterium]|nr:M24 family metallopeptidase [Chloroflexota bacterium]
MPLTAPLARAYPPVDAYRQRILPLRQRVDVVNAWLRDRLDNYLPELMAREGIDLWVVNTREYNEDPIIMTLMPAPAMSARRRTILVFARNADGTVDRLAVGRYGQKGYYERVWDPAVEEQYACLARVISERNPQRIAINTSSTFAFGDGLSHSDHDEMAAALGPELMARTCSAERLCVGWLEHRTAAELNVYPGIIEMGHALIAEAYSTRVIQPGITTTEDVVWWMMQKMSDLGLRPWFPPSVDIQAPGEGFSMDFSEHKTPRELILPGDVLHCDVGFNYLGLCSDQQQLAYVLKPGESDAPEGLRAALAQGNRLQDHLFAAMRVGQTGNQALLEALEAARAEGLNPQIYTHPIGYHGHAAGPTIGLWDQQQGVPGNGDYPLFDHTAYSIELNVRTTVPEWNDQPFAVMLEEEAALVDGAMRWLDGHQESWHLIG